VQLKVANYIDYVLQIIGQAAGFGTGAMHPSST